MKNLLRVLCLVTCLLLAASCALAEDEPSIIVVDGSLPEETPAPTAAPATPAPAATPEPTAAPVPGSVEAPEVRWNFPVSLMTLQSEYVMLVNVDNMLDKSFKPSPTVKMTGIKRSTSAAVYLQTTAGDALKEMFEAAKLVTSYNYVALNKKGEQVEEVAEYGDGMTLYLESGYRTYGQQSTSYNNRLANNNGVDDGYVAKPGASEHQTGLCADIVNADYATRMTQDYKWTPEAQWLKENCSFFGFILRYPEDAEDITKIHFEPWHFRYVGKEAAAYIMANGMTLEQFTADWKQALEEFTAAGGDVEHQIQYEYSRLNAPPESYVMDEYGTDGDAEVALIL